MGNVIYLDHAGTTGVSEEVLKLMLPYFSEKFGNASSVHTVGQEAKFALDNAREMVASCLIIPFTFFTIKTTIIRGYN